MKRITIMVVMLALAMGLGSGCASGNSQVAKYQAQADAYRIHAQQARATPILEIEGSNVCMTITGASRLALSMPVDPLPQMEREPTAGETIVDGIEALVPLAPYAAMWGIAKAIDNEHTTTTTTTETLVEAPGAEAAPMASGGTVEVSP